MPLKEMHGQYWGLVPNANNDKLLVDKRTLFSETTEQGYWLGKSFAPVTDTTGRGYNRFRRTRGKIVHTFPMVTRIGKSLVDGKPAYLVDYGAVDPKNTLMDELRKADDFIYFGVATFDAGNGKRSEPFFWILIGPTDDWVDLKKH